MKNPIEGKLDVHIDHSICNNVTNDRATNIKSPEKNKNLEFRNEELHDFDEHDDFDDLEEEEDLHAGENFWCSLCDDGGDLLL